MVFSNKPAMFTHGIKQRQYNTQVVIEKRELVE